MNLREQLSGLFWVGISVFVCVYSIENDTGSLHSPGPGFFPFWSGFIMGILGVVVVVTNSLKRKWKTRPTDLWKGLRWNNVIYVLFSLLLYCLLLPTAGYLITTFVLMFFLLYIMERSKIWFKVVNALVIVLMSYLIFCYLLDVKLPKGIFGF